MKKIAIPKFKSLKIENIIFDMNGTIQFQGEITQKVAQRLRELKKVYNIYLISSDTRGNLDKIADELGVKYIKIKTDKMSDAEAKNKELEALGKEKTITIGNGNNDFLMLKNACLGLLIIGSEGASTQSLMNSDVVFTNPLDAIDFLLDDKAMIATLRG